MTTLCQTAESDGNASCQKWRDDPQNQILLQLNHFCNVELNCIILVFSEASGS